MRNYLCIMVWKTVLLFSTIKNINLHKTIKLDRANKNDTKLLRYPY